MIIKYHELLWLCYRYNYRIYNPPDVNRGAMKNNSY